MSVYGRNWKDKFKSPPQDPTKIDKRYLSLDINTKLQGWWIRADSKEVKRALHFIGLRTKDDYQAEVDVLHQQGKTANDKEMRDLLDLLTLTKGDFHIENNKIIVDRSDYRVVGDFEIAIDRTDGVAKNLMSYVRDQRWKVVQERKQEAISHNAVAHVVDNFYAEYIDYKEFDEIYEGIYLDKEYPWRPEASRSTPNIIDLGSHIGLSVIWWKYLAPGAKITAVEANPETAEVLRRNVARNGLSDINVLQGAIASNTGTVDLYLAKQGVNFRWGDFANRIPKDLSKYDKITVPAIKLSDLITTTVDLLKIDIEGSELIALKEAESNLGFVKEIMMEFHIDPDNVSNSFAEMIDLLQRQGYQIDLNQWGRVIRASDVDDTKPTLVNIHAKRP